MKRTNLSLLCSALLAFVATACASEAPSSRGEDQIAKHAPGTVVGDPSDLSLTNAPAPCGSSDLSAAQSHCNTNHARYGASVCEISGCTVRNGYIVYNYTVYEF